MRIFLRLLLILAAGLVQLQGQNWPQFRGPDKSGVIAGFEIPTEWDAELNMKWKVPNPGKGWSSPIVWGDKIFLTASQLKGSEDTPQKVGGNLDRISLENEFVLDVVCFDKNNGEMLWRKTAYEGHPNVRTHGGSPYAAETPVTDGKRVYAHFGTMGLYAYDMDGQLAWKKDLGVYEMDGDWGTGTSPMMHEGILYMQIDNEDFSALIAIDGETGKELWFVSRDEASNRSTPMIWRNRIRTELVTQGAIVRSYNPQNGELLWQMNMQGGRSCSTPVGDSERLIVANEKRNAGGFMYSIKAGASGDISLAEGETSNHAIEWVNPNGGIAMSSPLMYQGKVYAFERRTGLVSCYDARNGDVFYYRKHLRKAREFWSSPWGYNGEVFCIDGKGITHVLDAGPDFHEVRQNVLDDQIWATPAFTPGSIVIRGAEYLYSIENGSRDTSQLSN
ncbi:MAG: PQQ-binding-like beta-propeller repeat protein [Verrucomicrobia bacterium]|nr:PQQ-binding-like beta-propeller repeat protein [Verrucomicrobiota bacterium]